MYLLVWVSFNICPSLWTGLSCSQMSSLAFRTHGLVYDRHSINICFYYGGECSEWERRRRDWDKEGNLHKNGACGLVCSYRSGKIMQLNASKDWGVGGGRDILVSYLPGVGQWQVFSIVVACFSERSFTLYSHFGKSPFLDARTELSTCKLTEQYQWP